MDKISALIPKVLSSKGLKDQAGASYAVYLAVDWLHEQSSMFAEQCIVTTLKDRVLTIECRNSIVLQEMHEKSESLRVHLNGFDGVSVERISLIRSTKS